MPATDQQIEVAISQAAYKVLANQFPTQTASFDLLMASMGLEAGASSVTTTPEGIGNLAAKAVLDHAHDDGSNQSGALTASGAWYGDQGLFTLPADIPAPDRWQPLAYKSAANAIVTPSCIAPHWGRVHPFALASASQSRPGPPASLSSQAFLGQAHHAVDVRDKLVTRHKVIAEYWADGPSSELPSGHWELFAAWVSYRDHHTMAQDVKLLFALANAIHDATIAIWGCKRD